MTQFFTKLASAVTAFALIASFIPTAFAEEAGEGAAAPEVVTGLTTTTETPAEETPAVEETPTIPEVIEDAVQTVTDSFTSFFSAEEETVEVLAVTTWYVNASNTSGTEDGTEVAPFDKIQDAIGVAAAGDTIMVAAGTYAEAVSVNKSISLIGAGKAQTIIAPASVASTGVGHKYTSNMKASLFVNGATDVVIEGFTIKDDGQTPGASGADAVVFWNDATGIIRNSAIDGDYAINGAQTGQGIAIDAGSGKTTTLRIENTDISGFQKNALDIVNGNSTASGAGTISVEMVGGSITGAGPTGLIAQNGIVTWDRAGGSVAATVDGTTISSIEYTGSNASASGILVYGTSQVSSVSNVTFTNVQDYINVAPGGASVDATEDNTFDGVSIETATVAQLGAIEDRMDTASDNATYSAVFLRPETYIVTENTLGLQAVIDAVPAGSTVLVVPGTYTGTITLNKSIVLEGANASASALSGTRGAESTVVGEVRVFAGDVTVRGLEITNPTWSSPSTIKGIHVWSSSPVITNIVIENNLVHDIVNASTKGSYGIMVQGTVDGVRVAGNTVTDISSAGWAHGIEVTPTGTNPVVPQNVVIEENTISNISNASGLDQFGFTVDWSNPTGGPQTFADASQVTFTRNSILGGATVRNLDDASLDLSGNYWGSETGPAAGQVTGTTTISNWYVDAALTSLNTDEEEENTGSGRSGQSRSSSSNTSTGTVGGGEIGGGQVLGASTYNFAANLTIGSTGADVNALQQMLIDAGLLMIPAPTGYFGDMTRAALAKWQAAHGVPATGYFGPLTMAAILAAAPAAPAMSAEERAAAIADLLEKVAELQAKLAEMMEDEA